MSLFEESMAGVHKVTESRTVTEEFIYVLGYKLELFDLIDLLGELASWPSDVHIDSHITYNALKKIDVIKSTSGTWGTTTGPNFEEFHKKVREIYFDEVP